MTTRASNAALAAAAAVGAALAILFALTGRGTFEHRVVAAVAAMAGAVLLLLAWLLHAIALRADRRWLQTVALGAAVAGVLGFSQTESYILGAVIHRRDVRAARAYAERLVAKLEELRKVSGRYPMALDEAVREGPEPPYLFRRGGVFHSSGDQFVLSFSEADGVIPHIVQYSSALVAWARF